MFQQARRQFKGLQGHDLIAAVSDFVATSTTYTPGLSHGTDSAVTTLMTGQGVCRDYAHVVIALLRAMDMPARYAACFAPGLQPMDFHAVAEAYLDGAWYVIDGTRLANRRSLVRIATGRDAADCAFLSYHGGYVGLRADARRRRGHSGCRGRRRAASPRRCGRDDADPADPVARRLHRAGAARLTRSASISVLADISAS